MVSDIAKLAALPSESKPLDINFLPNLLVSLLASWMKANFLSLNV
jgi:hypothetical protein